MAGELRLTLQGNVTGDPELRFTPGGDPVVNFTVAQTSRVFKDGGWTEGDTVFLRVSAWKALSENSAETLRKGDRVVVTGVLKQRSYETKEGEKRTVYEVQADDVAPSLMWASGALTKTSRGGSNGGGFNGGGNQQQQQSTNGGWGADTGGAAGGWGADTTDPPF